MTLEQNVNTVNNSSQVIFVSGGTKSGKSEFAEYLGKEISSLSYIALSEQRLKDENWKQKISKHRERRPKSWRLIETTDLISILSQNSGPLLIDSIGGFVMESICKENDAWLCKMNSLINHLKNRMSLTIIVGEQVGWSLVSEYEIGNKYIERIGELQKMISKISKENWLALNGRAIKIDEISLEIPF